MPPECYGEGYHPRKKETKEKEMREQDVLKNACYRSK